MKSKKLRKPRTARIVDPTRVKKRVHKGMRHATPFRMNLWESNLKRRTDYLMQLATEIDIEGSFTTTTKRSKRLLGAGVVVLALVPQEQNHEDGSPILTAKIDAFGNKESLLKGIEIMKAEVERLKHEEENSEMRIGFKPYNGRLIFFNLKGVRFADIRRWATKNGATGNFSHYYQAPLGLIEAKWAYWGSVWCSDKGGLTPEQEALVIEYYNRGSEKS